MATKDISDLTVCELFAEPAFVRDVDRFDRMGVRTGQPVKVCVRATERAVARGLIDYGVSLRSGWLTDKGRALIWNE